MNATLAKNLGTGAASPWLNGSHLAKEARKAGSIHYPVVACWLNRTYAVQLLQHETHPGIDHLLVSRHDNGLEFPWRDLLAIKDRFITDGQFRWAMEFFPPRDAIVDNCNLRHVWVMPAGRVPPIDLREVRT